MVHTALDPLERWIHLRIKARDLLSGDKGQTSLEDIGRILAHTDIMVCLLTIHVLTRLIRRSAACTIGLGSTAIKVAACITRILSFSEQGDRHGNPRSRHIRSL